MKKGMKEIKYLNEIEIEVDGKIYTITKELDHLYLTFPRILN